MARPRVSEVASGVYVVVMGRWALSSNVYLIRSGRGRWLTRAVGTRER